MNASAAVTADAARRLGAISDWPLPSYVQLNNKKGDKAAKPPAMIQ